MQTATQPETKWQSRARCDMRATSRYAKRRDIERWHEQKQLERELKEPTG